MATSVAESSSQTKAGVSAHPFTCVTCAIAFRSSDLQRGHMRSDWHRYNLKRRVASLPPLSSEIFAEKVLSAQASSSAAAAKATFQKTCESCQKVYYSENAYQNHLSSQRHKAKSAALQSKTGPTDTDTASVANSTVSLGEPLESSVAEDTHDPEVEAEFSKVIAGMKKTGIDSHIESPISRRATRPHHSGQDSRPEHPISPETRDTTPSGVSTGKLTENDEAVPLNRCLFCNYDSPNLKLSVLHMTKFHALFIPEQPYLVDLEGLVGYLQAKITQNHECLFCHKLKGSTGGVQTHMRDKGHCMIAFDTEEEMVEVGQFYDFRSSYSDHGSDVDSELDSESDDSSDVSKEEAFSGGVKLGAARTPKDDQDEEEGEEGWETDSSASSVDSKDIRSVPIDHDYHRLSSHRHHALHSDPRPHRVSDGFHSHAHHMAHQHAAFYTDNELFLPSGRTAGHRSLARYYRQNLHSYPSPAERDRRQQLLTDVPGSADEDNDFGTPLHQGERALARRDRRELGMTGVDSARKREALRATKREKERASRAEKRLEAKVQKRSNNQKHFRDPLLQ